MKNFKDIFEGFCLFLLCLAFMGVVTWLCFGFDWSDHSLYVNGQEIKVEWKELVVYWGAVQPST